VLGNPTQLHQVLLNLCVNARDAMPAGGRLSFAADNVELSVAEAGALPGARPGAFVSLLVSDTGTGMPPEVMAHIFEPFFTTKGEGRGTGIGLSTVSRIVKSHGGFLRVESRPGEGTTFELFWPRAAVAPAEAKAAPASHLPRGQGELILVADDEEAIRELVAETLAAQGYRVLTAASAPELRRLFEQHSGAVRLLLTDSLAATIQLARERQPGLPIILASGEAGAPDPAGDPPDVVRLRKPFALEELLAAVGRSLSKLSSDFTANGLGKT
jgi:two-component system cell cycle sensor histidine kinase/response regulator CckA